MKVWLVGLGDAEGGHVEHVCISYETAYRRFNEIRSECIHRLNDIIDMDISEGKSLLKDDWMVEWVTEIVELLEPDPNKLNNWPQDQPFMREIELEE